LIINGSVKAGPNVLMIGGVLVEIECAEYLLERGSQVTIVEMLDEVPWDMEPIKKKMTLMSLSKTAIAIITGTTVDRIDESGRAVVRTGDNVFCPRRCESTDGSKAEIQFESSEF